MFQKAVLPIIFLFVILFSSDSFSSDKEYSSLHEKVMAEKKIRCGYAMWSPVLFMDLKQGNKITGISYDIMDEIGKRLDLEIDWAEEAGWGNIVEGLATKRYDMICTGIGMISTRAKVIDFGEPLFYTAVYLVVREGDNRFDSDFNLINSPEYKIAVLEGEGSALLAANLFPEANVSAIPQMVDYSMLLKEIEMGKADATSIDSSALRSYQLTNPGKLRETDVNSPLGVYPVSFGLPQGEMVFNRMINVVLIEMLNDGTVERILDKYDSKPNSFMRVAKPYSMQN